MVLQELPASSSVYREVELRPQGRVPSARCTPMGSRDPCPGGTPRFQLCGSEVPSLFPLLSGGCAASAELPSFFLTSFLERSKLLLLQLL